MVDNTIFASSILSSNRVRLLFFLYTDPGAGALLWQLLLASLIGGAFYGRLMMRQIKSRIAGLKRTGSAYRGSLTDGHRSESIK
jgi:hypothetical protein